jgi:hypothetical protein
MPRTKLNTSSISKEKTKKLSKIMLENPLVYDAPMTD